MQRRHFISSLVTSGLVAATARADGFLSGLLQADQTDEQICNAKFKMALEQGLARKPIGDVVAEIGKSFVGSKYVAHTLEEPGEEHLVVNLRGFDCVSFYETSLCLARCVKLGKTTFDAFKRELTWIRYRSGVINGYPSRLHYTSDYFYDNVQKGVVKDMTKELGGVPFPKKVNFMSTHPESYPKLTENPALIDTIRAQEEVINKRTILYIPKENVASVLDKIHNGDILGTTTSMEGIDTSHTGITVWQDGQVHFMHAPLAGGAVEISKGNLSEYLLKNAKQTGIIIVRPQEPA